MLIWGRGEGSLTEINRLEAGPERVAPFRPVSLVCVSAVAIVLMTMTVPVGLARSTTWCVCHLGGLKRLLLSGLFGHCGIRRWEGQGDGGEAVNGR